MAMTIEVSDATFTEAVLDRSTQVPVIVDLWAPWCGPCRTLGPTLELVVGETDGAVELVKVNVDENPQISGAFSVQSIPAVYALFNRVVIDAFIGAQPESKVREFVDKVLVDTAIDAQALVDQDTTPEDDSEENKPVVDVGEVTPQLDALLEIAKTDQAARQKFLELLNELDDHNEIREKYRRALASRLF